MGKATKRTRENRTITIDFRDEATYCHLLGDRKAFLECILAFILSLANLAKASSLFRAFGEGWKDYSLQARRYRCWPLLPTIAHLHHQPIRGQKRGIQLVEP